MPGENQQAPDPNDSRFSLGGRVTFDNLAVLRGDGERFIREAPTVPVFSLAGLEGGDSAAVALLMAWFRLARHLGKEVVFVDVPDNLRNIIEVSGLAEVLPVQGRPEDGEDVAAAPASASLSPKPDPSQRDQ